MFIFLKKFFIDGFVPGDYTGGTVHDITILLLIASCIVFPILLYKKDKATIYKWMRIISIAMIIVYFVRRLIYVFNGGGSPGGIGVFETWKKGGHRAEQNKFSSHGCIADGGSFLGCSGDHTCS